MNINQIPCGVCQVFKYFATQMLKYYLQSKCLRSSSENMHIFSSTIQKTFLPHFKQQTRITNIYYRSILKVDFTRKT